MKKQNLAKFNEILDKARELSKEIENSDFTQREKDILVLRCYYLLLNGANKPYWEGAS